MDFKDLIKQLAERVEKLKDSLQTEEATKNALIMPFLQALGYDVFNPYEVIPEYTCDIGTKKGEKIDYAVMKDGDPCILIECKHWAQELDIHDNQLLRYFNVSKAKFGVLTNGIQYKFYTDLDKENVMDSTPFLDINLLDMKETQIEELKKFHKSYFDAQKIFSTAYELRFISDIKVIVSQEYNNPSEAFVKHLSKQVYQGTISAKMLSEFTGFVKKAFTSFVNDMITDRFNTALKTGTEDQQKAEAQIQIEEKEEPKVFTTEEEMEGYYIIKAILRQKIDPSRISHRDSQNYFSINLDDNSRKCICRLYLNWKKKYVAFIDESKKEERFEIQKVDDLYGYSEKLFSITEMLSGK